MNVQELQKALVEIILNIPTEDNDEDINATQGKALEIIEQLKDNINDKIEINSNLKITILDLIIRLDSQGNARLNNSSLLLLEDAVKIS